MNRREVLAAVAAAPLAPAPALAKAAPELVVYDPRYAPARALATRLVAHGAVAFETGNDVARLWYGPVRTRLAAGAAPRICGLTTWADFVVIKGCAAEARLTLTSDRIDGRPNAPSLVSWTVT